MNISSSTCGKWWVVAFLLAVFGGKAEGADRPNFIVFLVDDLGSMDIESNNPETFYETPHLSRLAQTGMRFTQAYTANPVCSPTRYSILTGRYPTRAGVTNWFTGVRAGRFQPAPLRDRMPLEEFTMSEAFQQAGYRTAFLGKWHLGPDERYWPETQGFEMNLGGHDRGSPRSFFSPYANPRLPDGPPGEHLPERLGSEAIRLIDEWQDEPFLLHFWFYSVHTPLQAPPELVEKYRRKAEQLPEVAEFAPEEQVWPVAEPRTVRVAQRHAVYAAMVESMDRQVGRVLARLDELGIADKTVILFFSDNGGLSTSEGQPTSNLPLRGGKGWLYEGGIRAPLLVRWPGVTMPGSVCDEPVISTDFYPTFLEMAGLELRPEQHQDGVSLVPLLKQEEQLSRDALYWHYPHYSNQGGFPGGAIRSGDYKLIERFEDGRVHLYNLREDLSEMNDLAARMPEQVEQLRVKLHAWYREVGAEFLRPHPGGPEPWRPHGN